MSVKPLVLVGLLILGVSAFSVMVLTGGIDELRLATQGARRDFAAEALPGASGWVGVYGCVRHDLAVGVTPKRTVYRVGTTAVVNDPDHPQDRDRVYTPLAAKDDCDEDKPPKQIYALIENDDVLGDTITNVYHQRVAPPPVAAIVMGVVGHGAGHEKLARAARSFYATQLGTVIDTQPLIAKGRQPGVLWVAIVSTAAGVHGFLFAALGVWWIVRRARRRRAMLAGHVNEEEEAFFSSETLD